MRGFQYWLRANEAVTTPPHMPRQWLDANLATIEKLEKRAAGVSHLSKEVAKWVYDSLGDRRMENAIENFVPWLPSPLGEVLRGMDDGSGFLRTEPLSYWYKSFMHALDNGWYERGHVNDLGKGLQRMLLYSRDRSEYRESLEHYFYFIKNYEDLKRELRNNAEYFGPENDLPPYEEAMHQLEVLKDKFDAVYDMVGWYAKFAPRIEAMIQRRAMAMQQHFDGVKTLPPHRPQEILYHATIDVPALLTQGFKTRAQLGTSALGGGPEDVISFTADLDVAKAIVDGIYEIIDIAQGRTSFQDIVNRTDREMSPEYIQQMIQQGRMSKHPMASPTWDYEHARERGFQGHGQSERELILSAYKSYLISHPRRYDPLFWGVKIEDFEKFDPHKVGIVACRVDMSRVTEYLASMEEFRVPPDAVLSVKQIPYRSPYFRGIK